MPGMLVRMLVRALMLLLVCTCAPLAGATAPIDLPELLRPADDHQTAVEIAVQRVVLASTLGS